MGQSKLKWYETEYYKLAAINASGNKKREKRISSCSTPWLPFDSKEELEQARQEAEAEAQKLLDDKESHSKPQRKSKHRDSLPEHLPEVKQLCDVAERRNMAGTD